MLKRFEKDLAEALQAYSKEQDKIQELNIHHKNQVCNFLETTNKNTRLYFYQDLATTITTKINIIYFINILAMNCIDRLSFVFLILLFF